MKPKNIDEYIENFPAEMQVKLQKIREVIRATVPEATEALKYQMPTFVYKGNLVHFAGYKNHIGFYPTSSGKNAFLDEVASYAGGKGTIQFPLDRPVPYDLIERIVRFRVQENLKKAKLATGIRDRVDCFMHL